MITVILVIHLLIATTLVGVILIQRSEGGALGGLGGGNMGGLMTARGTANLLTRTTAILATCFMCTSLLLAILASRGDDGRSILDSAPAAPLTAPNAPLGGAPAAPATPPVAPPSPAGGGAPAAPGEPAAPIAR